MIDRTDLVSLRVRVRDLIGEETAALWTQDAVDRAINAEVMRLARKVIDLDSGYFDVSYTATMAATITLPANCYRVRNIEVLENGAYRSLRWIPATQKTQHQGLTTADSPNASSVRFQGNTLVFDSGIGSAASIRLIYARMPAEMRYEAATAGGASTITFASTASPVDDIYNEDQIIILAGASAGDVRVISDYAGSTKIATVSAAFTATPDTTSYFSTLLPEPLGKYPDVVALGAAVRLVGRRRDSEMYGILSDGYQRDVTDMMDSLTQRQTDQSRRVNFIPDGDDF